MTVAVLTAAFAGSAAAQRGWDIGGQALTLLRDSSFVGGAVTAGLRSGRGLRVGASAGAGWVAPDAVGGRGELLVTYHLSTPGRRAVGAYAGAGIAADLVDDDLRGLVLAVIGFEAQPWFGGGVFAELGVGGGVRLAAGYRWIHRNARGTR